MTATTTTPSIDKNSNLTKCDQEPLTLSEMEIIRSKTKTILEELDNELPKDIVPLWIDHDTTSNKNITTDDNIQSRECRFFNHYGFLHVSGFAADEEVHAMKQEMEDMVERDWKPELDGFDSFGTDDKANTERGDYFLESASRVHYFVEPKALMRTEEEEEEKEEESKKDNNNKKKSTTSQQLKPEYKNQKKICALNKVGHGIHTVIGSSFYKYTTSNKLYHLVTNTLGINGWCNPVVPQSMYILKQPKIGGVVTSHQDSTFLYTTPKQSCLGLWLALHDSNLQNGCLWVRPKSHIEPVRRQYKRNEQHFTSEIINERLNFPKGDTKNQPKFIMEDLYNSNNDNSSIPWEGTLPGLEGKEKSKNKNEQEEEKDDDDNYNVNYCSYESLMKVGFIPIECKAGDLLCFPGQLDHLSLPNFSNLPRHTFQLHLIEGSNNNTTTTNPKTNDVVWSKYNWLQYPSNQPFLKLGSN